MILRLLRAIWLVAAGAGLVMAWTHAADWNLPDWCFWVLAVGAVAWFASVFGLLSDAAHGGCRGCSKGR